MSRWIRVLFITALLAAGTAACVLPVAAAEVGPQDGTVKTGLQREGEWLYYYTPNGELGTGWMNIDGNIYYFRPEDTGKGPRGSASDGLCWIEGNTYYFDETFVLQTGWQTIGGKVYYFNPTGDFGEIGAMAVGLKKIDGKKYYFNAKGIRKTGWIACGNKMYYFSKSKDASVRGTARTGWKTIGGERYYFGANGVLRTSQWIKDKYYVDSQGRMLKNTVTPDGYIVNASGVKGKLASGFVKIDDKVYYYKSGQKVTGILKKSGKRYYFDEDGVRQENGFFTVNGKTYCAKDGVLQTGWTVYEGWRYYFKKSGKMVSGKTVDGVALGPDGKAALAILLMSGHGQGDPGATADYGTVRYEEQNLTREFSTLVYNYLRKLAPGLTVVMYDQNYDCYQVLSGRKAGPEPQFKAFSYVLEIHFNATAESSKDLRGDGSCKGTGMYINSAKADTTLDRKIVAAAAQAAGLPIWGRGDGIFRSSGLLNARTCQGLNVPYGLLETAFIDDRDDMTRYNSKKKQMAKAVAVAIKDYYGL